MLAGTAAGRAPGARAGDVALADFARRADEIMAPVLGMCPSEQAVAALEAGMSRLDALADDMRRMAERRGLPD